MTVVITPGRRAATAATIRVRRLFECGDYSSAATIRVRRLIKRIRYAQQVNFSPQTVALY